MRFKSFSNFPPLRCTSASDVLTQAVRSLLTHESPFGRGEKKGENILKAQSRNRGAGRSAECCDIISPQSF